MYLLTTITDYCETNEVFLYDGVMNKEAAVEIVKATRPWCSVDVEVRKLASKNFKVDGIEGGVILSSIEHFDESFKTLYFRYEVD